jgi:hypothetical protein
MKQPSQYVPFVGFAPDLPPNAPGVWTDCSNVIPTSNGFRAQPTPVAAADARGGATVTMQSFPLSGHATVQAYAAYCALYSSGTVRVFAASATQLLECVAGVWNSVCGFSFSTASSFTKGFKPMFKQFGDDVLFNNGVDPMFILVGAGGTAFTSVGTQILNEAQVFPIAPGGAVILNNSGGTAFGVVIHSTITGGTIYTLGTDYTVNYNYQGNGQIQVTFLATGHIAPGATVYINYFYGAPNDPVAIIEAGSFFNFVFYGNAWACSAAGNDQLYDFTVADLSAGDTLTDTPGPIVAGNKFNRNMMAYKGQGVYLGTFVGAPVIWQWLLLDPLIGTWGPGCVCNMGNMHALVGLDDFYINNGVQLMPIQGPQGGPNPVRQWFFGTVGAGSSETTVGDLNKLYAFNIESIYDLQLGIAFWYYPSQASVGPNDSWIAWNKNTGTWTHGRQAIDCLFQPRLLPATTGDGTSRVGFFEGTTHLPKQYGNKTAVAGLATFTTGDWGDGVNFQFSEKALLFFKAKPISCNAQGRSRANSGDVYTLGDHAQMDAQNQNTLSLIMNDVWLSYIVQLTGDFEVMGMWVSMERAGEV